MNYIVDPALSQTVERPLPAELTSLVDPAPTADPMVGQLTTAAAVSQFVLGGKAIFTLEFVKTGKRFTFRVDAGKKAGFRFVKVLVGPENSTDYAYLGYFRNGKYAYGDAKSSIGADADSARAFAWFARCLAEAHLSPLVRVWHSGRCAHCARRLTVPASVYTGFGPDCAEKLGIEWAAPVCEAA